MKAVTANQMRAIEQGSVTAGVSLDQLMENAGLAVANVIMRRNAPFYGKRVVVLVGPGNNGGDGLVAAWHLARHGAHVRCFLVTKRPESDPKRELAEQAGSVISTVDGNEGEFQRALKSCDLIVDAILGTGRARPIDERLGNLLSEVEAAGQPVYAIDLPTGLDADSGRFDPLGLPADTTLMLGLPKLGSLAAAGDGRMGIVEVLDIGLPSGLADNVKSEFLDVELAKSLLPERPPDANKGTFGRALIMAGSPNYVGAAVLATRSAARSGAGLVAVATPQRVYALVAARVSDAIYHPLPEEQDGQFSVVAAARELSNAAKSASALLIGPGLGRATGTESLVRTFLALDRGEQPAVLDADCLNILSGTAGWWDQVPGPKILTPHPGEMGRLLGMSAREVQDDRLGTALTAAEKFGATVVLKGAATVIAAPDGRVRVSPWVNPGLAKGGTGDVLAGLAVGFLAQVPGDPYAAASLAVYVHGLAGDIAKTAKGPVAMTASDVVDSLPAAFLELGVV